MIWSIMPEEKESEQKDKELARIYVIYSFTVWLIVMAVMIYVSVIGPGSNTDLVHNRVWIGFMSLLLVQTIMIYYALRFQKRIKDRGH